MRRGTDWLEVVYAAGLEMGRGGSRGARSRGARTEIRVRENPALVRAQPGREQRMRVTVAPSDPGLSWRLFLRDFGAGPGGAGPGGPGPGEARGRTVWWRIEPGTWQPLGGSRQCVAEGRGRVRVDVSVRIEKVEAAPPPRLRFVAESA